ncbi:L,D-transpeptidase [Pelomonas sp. KK5]|uniref:L,D-transpeptidase n=1 Tax=Pelomonas sp. KK5 TaxID=1855730 RepID=UPI001E38DA2F|nr:L,D-transpeptidase [Pelomonas sp. KK5]
MKYWVGAFLALATSVAMAATSSHPIDFSGQPVTPDARRMAEQAFASGDTAGKPFAVVDKKQARIYVFEADGRMVGSASSLLGLARGDASAPGVGTKVSTGIPLAERTTPAGRFDSEPGHNIKGEAIVWVDYGAAVAIHRLRPAPAEQRRPERLASANPDDKRISLGCIVVAPAFYDGVIAPTLGRQRGVVYVLPETEAGMAGAGRNQTVAAQSL